MMMPNVKVMSEAIKAHVAGHVKKMKDPAKAAAEAERIQDDLIAQVLKKARISVK